MNKRYNTGILITSKSTCYVDLNKLRTFTIYNSPTTPITQTFDRKNDLKTSISLQLGISVADPQWETIENNV